MYIEWIRTAALSCVILFHTVGMLENKSGLCMTDSFRALGILSGRLVGLAVPFFFFISGYLYKKPLQADIPSFLLKKAVRLLVPYVAVATLIMLTSGYFDVGQIYGGGFYHLWFLTALFWCFVFSSWLDYTAKAAWIIPAVSFGMSVVRFPEILGLQEFFRCCFYFALGAFMRNRPWLAEAFDRHRGWTVMGGGGISGG